MSKKTPSAKDIVWFDLKTPCRDCPFKRTTPKHEGVAADLEALFWRSQRGDAAHTCHMTDPRSDSPIGQRHTGFTQHCAGFMILQVKQGDIQKPVENAEKTGMCDLRELNIQAPVYDSMIEMMVDYAHWIKRGSQIHSTMENPKMGLESQIEREEEIIEEQYAAGLISLEEYNKQIRELHREYREAAREAAERAYEDELERW